MEDKQNKVQFPLSAYMQVEGFAISTHITNLISTFGLERVKEIAEYEFKLQDIAKEIEEKAG